LKALADEFQAEFLDLQRVWGEYIRGAGLNAKISDGGDILRKLQGALEVALLATAARQFAAKYAACDPESELERAVARVRALAAA
jgi:hypothetical protein